MVQWQIKSNFRSISEQLQSKIVSLIRSVFGLRCFPLAVADSGANKSNYIKLDFKTTQSCSSGKLEAVRVQPFNNSFFFSFLCFLLYLRPYFYNDKQESISGPFVHAVPGENLEPFPSTHFDGFAALWTLSASDKKEGR